MTDKSLANSSLAEKELDKAQAQFDVFDKTVKDLTLDNLNQAPKLELEPQTKLSQKEIEKSKEIWLKPKRTYPPGVNPKTGEREKFNEKFREEYNFKKEYVQFIAENVEIIGEAITLSIKKFPGTPIEDWEVPTNVPVWGPRMLAERLADCGYHILRMENRQTGSEDGMTYYGQMVAKSKVQRLDARPVSTRKSIFMSESNFKAA